jgi:hypothetical protein
MFEISQGIVLHTSILEFLPACWRAMPTKEEFYDIDWREERVSTIYADITEMSYREKSMVHHEQRHGQATRISDADFERQELWGGVKSAPSPDQWTHRRGVLESRTHEGYLQPAVRNKYLGVFFQDGQIHDDFCHRAVRSLLDDNEMNRVIHLPLVTLNEWRVTLRCSNYRERWESGICVDIEADRPLLIFYSTKGPRFQQYVPRDDMDWSGFYFVPKLNYPNATDKMIFLSKLRELTDRPKSVNPL